MKYNNGKYEILSPEGFVDFLGVQKLQKKTIEVIFSNNITLRGSINHTIFDYDNHQIKLSELNIGNKIKSIDGFLEIINIFYYDDETDVFDIIDSGQLHLYYTNNIISHNCNFLGSGDNVFDSLLMQKVKENMIREPQNKMIGNSLWIWKEPVMGHKYVMGVDVSRGDSEDFSSFQIIDFDEREQVAEYVGKLPPDTMAELCYKWGNMYNCFIVIDITGGMGVSTSRKLQEMGYKNLYVDGVDLANKWKYDPKALDKIPGINFNNKRVQIIASFEEAMRHQFRIYSTRLYNEMNTFVYVNGRPDHQKGQHDDLIMSVAMATYVAESSFTSLEKVSEHTKAMLESWSVSNNENVTKQIEFNPVIPHNHDRINQFNGQNLSKEDYMKYNWLFGGGKYL
jgi:hypothetical protein